MDLSSRLSSGSSRIPKRHRDYRDEEPRRERGSGGIGREDPRGHYGSERPRRRRRDESDFRRHRESRERSYREDERPRRERRYDDYEPRSLRYSSVGRSRSPPPSRERSVRSIEQELEQLRDVTPINQWKRKRSLWDIKPPGYELVTADQAKMSGVFPLPGAPRAAVTDPEKLLEFARSAEGSIIAPPPPLQPGASRQARRLVVTGIPNEFVEDAFVSFIEDLFISTTYHKPETKHFSSVNVCKEENFAILEVATPEDATFLWGLQSESYSNDVFLKFQRIQNYIVPQITPEVSQKRSDDYAKNDVLDSKDKIYISNLPLNLGEDQVVELLKPFGDLLSFQLIKNIADGSSKGFCFCEFKNPSDAEVAISGLDGKDTYGNKLHAQFACVGLNQAMIDKSNGMAILTELAKASSQSIPTRVLQLHNLITGDEIMDVQEYEDIYESVKTQFSNYGPLIDIKIPRSIGTRNSGLGTGKVFVRYSDIRSAEVAMEEMKGCKFNDRTIVIAFYGEDCYKANAW
ncbi:U2 small nuclear RNA auxiliary factor small subunit, U2AF-59 [Schizosaccharomyces pombe]|uniref:Splicing factor U2AF 59 kDa subunit n=2 Tax=Schizosaccharomyces pombe (strain 972 / ATCC 24843) TaxID=284812 RepID=U2AF2_SCHPO|nr:U2AF large subunit (U2AF-59) [Schizosaccharomyces pombe]P36629.1 RecName: Full=Splicing factor U2AF 59 kDa subunit; AltName: Full=U2 auxiliary factor 59 kDa subunit; Short=U2AF59; AltName: Full=U2 snRNP auxiliary factor large subunit [Schizosaccharomyces pombe 972h-]AAA03578.1 splicing factor U2AF large subunit [Schizosaccharomyces pombe]CAB46760.1 U2AF large subunit (U2AF-59) [Schizosaccharomyces pombe]|eukprot:NP_595396.1 U2AF large subunit (U2AF-59) [Schizosaccharomyces pombe]